MSASPTAAALQLAGDLTIELWVNVSLATRQTLISKGYLYEFELTLETDGRLNFYQGNGVAFGGLLSAFGAVTANTWQHVVVTRAAATKTIRFYVNGVAKGSGTSAVAPNAGPKPVAIAPEPGRLPVHQRPARRSRALRRRAQPGPGDDALRAAAGVRLGHRRDAAAVASDSDSDALTYGAAGLPPGSPSTRQPVSSPARCRSRASARIR